MKNRIKSFVAKHDVEITTAVALGSISAVGLLALYMTGRTVAAEAALAESRRNPPLYVWNKNDENEIRASYQEPINL